MANRLLADRDMSPVGNRWARNFVKRHEELDMRFFRKYDYQRAKCEDPTIIYNWFMLVQNTIAKYGILLDGIYNFDETGFLMGMIASGTVVTGSEKAWKTKISTAWKSWMDYGDSSNQCGRRGWFHRSSWLWANITSPTGTKKAISRVIGLLRRPKMVGANNETGFEWLKHFDQHTTNRSKGVYRLLILDGHGSHHSADFEMYCEENNIITLCMPPHSFICFSLLTSGVLVCSKRHMVEK